MCVPVVCSPVCTAPSGGRPSASCSCRGPCVHQSVPCSFATKIKKLSLKMNTRIILVEFILFNPDHCFCTGIQSSKLYGPYRCGVPRSGSSLSYGSR